MVPPPTATITPSLFVNTPSTSGPLGLVMDSSNNMYCSYYDANSIVKITPNGTITTLISTGLDKPNGLIFDSLGNLYCVNNGSSTSPGNSSIIKFNPNASPIVVTTLVANSSTNNVGLFRGQQLAFDSSGNLYCACYGNNKILKITPSNVVSTFVDLTTGGANGLAFDSLGNLYCSLFISNKIVKITSDGSVSDFITTGLNRPAHFRFDIVGNLYCSNSGANTILRISPNGNVTTFASSTSAQPLSDPRGLAFDSSGNLFVANYAGKYIRKYTITKITTILSNFGDISKIWGNEDFDLVNPNSNQTNESGALSFSSSNENVATISGNTVHIVGAGTTNITATQAETTNYTSASITATLTVEKATPALSNLTFSNKIVGDSPFSIGKILSDSSGALSYSSSNTLVAEISGNIITIVGPGQTTITATQEETDNYTSGSTSGILTVLENSQSNPVLINDNDEFLYFVRSTANYGVLNSNIPVITDEWITSNSLKLIKSNDLILITKENNLNSAAYSYSNYRKTM
jgi:sugar lactone lactonase YvrE